MSDDLNLMDLIGEDEVTAETTTPEAPAEVVEETVTEVVEETIEETAETVVEETAAKPTESAVEETVETETTTADESGLEAPEESEVVVEEEVVIEEAAKAPEKMDEKYTTTAEFLTAHVKKISNAYPVPVTGVSSIPEGKYLLFVSAAEEDAEMVLLDTPNRLAFINFAPEKILIEKSGVIASNASNRLYVAKTNVIQYAVNENGSPTSVTTFKKVGVKQINPTATTKSVEGDTKSVDEIKLHITATSTPLAKKVTELKTVDELRKATVEFLDTIVDINHLLKINNMMMTCGI